MTFGFASGYAGGGGNWIICKLVRDNLGIMLSADIVGWRTCSFALLLPFQTKQPDPLHLAQNVKIGTE